MNQYLKCPNGSYKGIGIIKDGKPFVGDFDLPTSSFLYDIKKKILNELRSIHNPHPDVMADYQDSMQQKVDYLWVTRDLFRIMEESSIFFIIFSNKDLFTTLLGVIENGYFPDYYKMLKKVYDEGKFDYRNVALHFMGFFIACFAYSEGVAAPGSILDMNLFQNLIFQLNLTDAERAVVYRVFKFEFTRMSRMQAKLLSEGRLAGLDPEGDVGVLTLMALLHKELPVNADKLEDGQYYISPSKCLYMNEHDPFVDHHKGKKDMSTASYSSFSSYMAFFAGKFAEADRKMKLNGYKRIYEALKVIKDPRNK